MVQQRGRYYLLSDLSLNPIITTFANSEEYKLIYVEDPEIDFISSKWIEISSLAAFGY